LSILAALLLLGNVILLSLPETKPADSLQRSGSAFIVVEPTGARRAESLDFPLPVQPLAEWTEAVEVVFNCGVPQFIVDIDSTGYQAAFIDKRLINSDLLRCLRKGASYRLKVYINQWLIPSYRALE
jgi:hypothetical protein